MRAEIFAKNLLWVRQAAYDLSSYTYPFRKPFRDSVTCVSEEKFTLSFQTRIPTVQTGKSGLQRLSLERKESCRILKVNLRYHQDEKKGDTS